MFGTAPNLSEPRVVILVDGVGYSIFAAVNKIYLYLGFRLVFIDDGFWGATEQKTGVSSEYQFVNVYISANSWQMR
jgi:hypothetical protein